MDDGRTPTPAPAVQGSVPLVVIGGYLGTGKTTLVNHLLREAAGRRITVLVNDFGDVSIDADLIEGASEGVLALAGGCVCCSFGDDLVGTLRQAAQRTPRPDILLLECSGVGLPAAVARSAALVLEVRVEGIVVVADAAQLRQQSGDRYVGDTVRQQLREADLLVLNHQDRCTPQEAMALRNWLADCAHGVPLAACERGRVPADLVLGVRADAHADGAAWHGSGGRYRASAAPLPHPMRHFQRRVDHAVDPHALARELVAASGGRLLRAKGVVPGFDGRHWRVQVMGRRIEIEAHVGAIGANAGTVVGIELLTDPWTPQPA